MSTQENQSSQPIYGAGAPVQRFALPRLSARGGAALIAGLALLVYLPALDGDFVLDDDIYLTNNPLIAAPNGWYQFWITAQKTMDFYPVSNTTLWIEWRLWATHATGYHVTNLLLHIASALLLWTVLRKLEIPGAFLAALLFTVHPVNVESVAWIAQRKGLLAVLFFLLAIFWFLKADETQERSNLSSGEKWYWLSLLAFMLAVLSKGSVVILPFVLLGLVWWRRRRITMADYASTLPYFLVAAVLLVLNLWAQSRGFSQVVRSVSFAERTAGAGSVIWFYLSKALLPINQVFIYPKWRIEIHDLLWWLPPIAAVIVTIVLWLCRDVSIWSRSLLFAWGFFCVALVPVLGFTDVGFMNYSLVADHYQHVALIGVVAIVAAGFEYWRTRVERSAPLAPTIIAATGIAVLSLLTWQQAGRYSGPITLYTTLLTNNPESVIAHYNLGNSYLKSNRLQEAIEQYGLALKFNPNHSEAMTNLGAALVSAGRPQEALEKYQQVLHLNPDNLDALANMALAYAALKRAPEAVATAENAARSARSQGEIALAEQIEAWLRKYLDEQSQRYGEESAPQNKRAVPDGP